MIECITRKDGTIEMEENTQAKFLEKFKELLAFAKIFDITVDELLK